jgi:hypothetical protein
MSSNIDEHVRRLPPSANEGGALLGLSRERSGSLLRWKAPRALDRRRIDVLRRERARSTGKGLLRQPDPAAERGVRGRDRRGCRQPRKQRRSCSPHASAHEVWVSKGLKPAVRRQARGRWRPDDREVVRRRARGRDAMVRARPRNRAPAGLPTAVGDCLQRGSFDGCS